MTQQSDSKVFANTTKVLAERIARIGQVDPVEACDAALAHIRAGNLYLAAALSEREYAVFYERIVAAMLSDAIEANQVRRGVSPGAARSSK